MSFGWLVIAILLCSLAIRVAAACTWQRELHDEGKSLRFGDSDSYWVLANRIAAGEEYHYAGENSRIFRAPLYPLVLSPIASLGRIKALAPYADWFPYWLARCLGAFLGTFTVALVMRMAWEISGEVAAIASGVCSAIYPGAIGMSVFILSEAIFCPLIALCLYGTWRGIRILAMLETQHNWGRTIGWSLVAGAAYGGACLARPSWSLWGFFLAAYLGAMVLTNWRIWRIRSVAVLLMLVTIAITICLTMAPWWIRNYQITGRFVPTTLQVGPSLYDGLHPGASGSSDEGMIFVEEFWHRQSELDEFEILQGRELESTYEWRLNRLMHKAALDWVRENPGEAIRLGFVKLVKTWRPLPVANEVGSQLIRYSEGGMYLGIAMLGAVGAWASRKVAGSWLFILPSFYFSALHMVFIGSIRYRQPAVLVLCILAGVGICYLWNKSRKGANASF